jgi:hypothetical protein
MPWCGPLSEAFEAPVWRAQWVEKGYVARVVNTCGQNAPGVRSAGR